MPLESVWLDTNYLATGANFEVNTTSYPNLAAFRSTLDKKNQKIVLDMNTGFDATNLADHYIIEGQDGEAFVKSILYPEGDYQGALVTDANAK
jgi:alpha-glucosidase (family GH31 glycosyl hydrolase)